MIQKRPFVDDDSYELACKHPRHLEHIDQLTLIASLNDSHPKTTTSDGGNSLSNCQTVGRSSNEPVIAVSDDNSNFESGVSGCFPHFLWIDNGILETDNLSFFPEYFDHGHQLRALLQPDEVFSSFDYPLWKPVSIGPEHQAIVPEWEGPTTSSNQLDKSNPQVWRAKSSKPGIIVDDGYEERMMGVCVVPMPDFEAYVTHCCQDITTVCSCLDQGSIECVKQHIMEVRQKLRDNLGEEKFEALGFYDMGEEVAKKWTEEEEQIFHDVVLSNPASLGKNFWDHLAVAFPSRTKRELVSYYFNVFMLRIRSEQNRLEPLDIDSDIDEWQRSEGGMEEGDEDSAVESLSGKDAPADYQEDHVDDCNEHIEDEYEDEYEDEIDASKESADDDVQIHATDEEYEGDVDDIAEAHASNSINVDGGNGGFEIFKGIPSNKRDDFDIEDDSCTSYEYQRDDVDSRAPLDVLTDGRHSGQ